jgi:hypothetical protein
MTDRLASLRSVSREAFGQSYRLEVMLAISRTEDGLVNLTDLASTLSLSPSQIQGALRSLVMIGLLTEMPPGDSRRRFLLRNHSAAWAWAEEMAASVFASEGRQLNDL